MARVESNRWSILLLLASLLIVSSGLGAKLLAAEADELKVDCRFPGGNIIVDRIDGDTVHIRQDLRDTKGWWFWWNFRVQGAAGRALRFQFDGQNPIGVLGPAVSHDRGVTWSWLGAESMTEASFSYAFAADASDVRFAFAMPYQRSHFDKFIRANETAVQSGTLLIKTLCKTRKGRDVPVVKVHQPAGESKYRVLLTARHHACESMASYSCEGFLQALLAESDHANC